MKIVGKEGINVDSTFAEEIARRSGENVFLCYQCKKCASGCPNRKFMNSTPTELMRYIQLGMIDEAMKKNTIWYCLSCHICSARCPEDIDIPHVVDTLRILVKEKKIKVEDHHKKLFNRLWMTIIKFLGRGYEAGLVGALNLLTLKPFKDLPLGFKMIKKGKLKMLPSIKKPFATMKMFSRAKKLKK